MDLPSPPLRAHIPVSSFPAATAPAAQGVSSPATPLTISPFESPNVSRPPSPGLERGHAESVNWSRSNSTTRILDERGIGERSGSHSKNPEFKRSLSGSNTRLLERALSMLSSKRRGEEEPRGRTARTAHESNLEEQDIELPDLTGRGKAIRLDSSANSVKSTIIGNEKKGWLIRETAQLVVAFAQIAMVGMNDSATGANLPSMQEFYGVSFDIISLVFLSNVAGYFVSCVSSSFLSHNLGVRNTLSFASLAWIIGCILLLIRPPFPVFILSLAFLGFGGGLYDAVLTTVISHEEDGVLMSLMYSCFGFGAAVAPVVIGSFIDKGVSWNKYYYMPMGLSFILAIFAHLIFQGYETPPDEQAPLASLNSVGASSVVEGGEVFGGRATMSAATRMKRALKLRSVWVGFLLILLAFGTGDTLSAWMTTYLAEVRGAPSATSRYALSGLWGGVAFGRVIIPLLLSSRLGEKTFSITMLLLASSMLGVAWAVQDYKIDAVVLSLSGFFIGPVTPKCLSMVGSRVPPSLKASVMSLTIGLGLVGSAVGPLLFGIVAGRGLLSSLPGTLIVLCVIAAGSWMLIPKNTRRED